MMAMKDVTNDVKHRTKKIGEMIPKIKLTIAALETLLKTGFAGTAGPFTE